MKDYSKITDEEFDAELLGILELMSAQEIIAIPGIYEILSDHLNNEILDAWAEKQPQAEDDEDDSAWENEDVTL